MIMTMMTTMCRTRRGGEEEPKEKEQNSVNQLCQILNAMLKHIFFHTLLICSRVFVTFILSFMCYYYFIAFFNLLTFYLLINFYYESIYLIMNFLHF